MYGNEDEGASSQMRQQLIQEFERLKEQSQKALEQVWARVEELQGEDHAISEELEEKERKLHRLRLTKSMNADQSQRDQDDDEEGSDHSTNDEHFSVALDLDPEENVRVQLMIQEREEKILEIKEILHGKQQLLQTLREDTAEQQETIQGLQRELEALQQKSGKILEEKVRVKEREVAEQESELEDLLANMEETEKEHLQLAEEWHDREDTVADAETDAADRIKVLQDKLDKYKRDLAVKEAQRSAMFQESSEALEEMRQDLMEYLGPDGHNIMSAVRKAFDSLRDKEDELAIALVRRVEERKNLGPLVKKLEKLSGESSGVIRKVGKVLKIFDNKLRNATEEASEDVEDLINNIQEQIAVSFDEMMEELTVRLDKMEGLAMGENSDSDSEREEADISEIKRNVEKLSYTIRARFRQLERVLPDAKLPLLIEDDEENIRRHALRIESLEAAVEDKEEELKALQEDLEAEDDMIDDELIKTQQKVEFFEKEIKFLVEGLEEKDRMIYAILGIVKDRQDAEAELLEELEYVYRKGIITEEDFQDTDQYLWKSLSQRHQRA